MPEGNEPPKMHTLTLRIPEDWYETLRDEAHRERLDITDLIRDALADRHRFRKFRMIKGAKPRVEYVDERTPGGASLTNDQGPEYG